MANLSVTTLLDRIEVEPELFGDSRESSTGYGLIAIS